MNLTIGCFSDAYAPQINGITTLLKLLKREFERRGHRFVVLAPRYARTQPTIDEPDVIRFPAFKFILDKQSRVTVPLRREARKVFQDLDVVHSHTEFSLGLLGIRAARAQDIPHLHTYHTLYAQYRHYFPKLVRPSERFVGSVSAAFINRCDAVTVSTTPMVEELQRYGIHVPIHRVPFGMDLSTFNVPPSSDIRREFDIGPNEKILLSAGRVAHEKNLSFVIEAFDRARRERDDLRLLIVGDGPARADLEAQAAELRLGDRLIFTGYRDWAQLVDDYKQADLFVYGSKTETQGIVFMEAQAAGLPVVAVGAMGALEAIKPNETGVLLDPDDDAASFATAILGLLADDDRRSRLSRNARAWAEANSLERTVDQLLGIYREMLASEPPPTVR